MAISELDRRGVVDGLQRQNRSKSFRRLDQHLSGVAGEIIFLREVAQVLKIPFPQVEAALEHDSQQLERELARERHEGAVRWFERTGPHLWITLPGNYSPSLITVLGPEFFLLVPVPSDIIELPDYEQFQEVGIIVRAHFNDPNRRPRQIAGYRFRRTFEESFNFNTEGDFLGRIDGATPSSVVRTSFRRGLHRLRRVIGLENGGR